MVSTTSASVEAQDLRSMEQTVSEAVEALIDRVLTETYIQSCAEDRTRAVQQVEEMVKREQERDHMESHMTDEMDAFAQRLEALEPQLLTVLERLRLQVEMGAYTRDLSSSLTVGIS